MQGVVGGGETLLYTVGNHPVCKQSCCLSTARQNWGIQGTVFVYFVVGEDGNVRDVKVLRGVHRHLDLEAVRVVQSMPKFVPGFLEGEFVPVEYTIPVKFIIRRPAGNRRP